MSIACAGSEGSFISAGSAREGGHHGCYVWLHQGLLRHRLLLRNRCLHLRVKKSEMFKIGASGATWRRSVL